MLSAAQKWINNEDTSPEARAGRLSRLEWIAENYPLSGKHVGFPGMMAMDLFEEMRYCYVYGQFLSCIFLGLAFIEKAIASRFHMRGDEPPRGFRGMLRVAAEEGIIRGEDVEAIEEAAAIRNAAAHFRPPGEDGWALRIALEGNPRHEVYESNAKAVILAVFQFMRHSPHIIQRGP